MIGEAVGYKVEEEGLGLLVGLIADFYKFGQIHFHQTDVVRLEQNESYPHCNLAKIE